MNVASVQLSQSTSKPNKGTHVNQEEFSLVLGETIDREEPIMISHEKDEEKSNQLLEMMMAYLGLNLPNDNSNESMTMEDIENQTQGLIDLESSVNKETNINMFPNERLVTEDLSEDFLQSIGKFADTINPESTGNLEQNNVELGSKLPELGGESLLVQNDSKLSINNLDVKTSLNDKSGEKGFQVDDLLQKAEKVQYIKEAESLEETELKNGEFLNKSFDIEKNNSSLLAKDTKTDGKIETAEDDLGLKLIDNSHIKTTNNTTVDFKDVKLSNENTQKVNDTIIQLVETTKEGDTSLLKVKLYPENLGTVDVTVKMEEGKLTANILVDNEQIKGMFNKAINELSESLVKQNIQIEKINIDLKFDTNPNFMNQSFDQGQNESFNPNQNNMRNRNIGSYFQNTESLVSNEGDVYNSGELSILA